MTRAAERLETMEDLRAEEACSIVTVSWPATTGAGDGFGRVSSGSPATRSVPCLANTRFNRERAGSLADGAEAQLMLAAADTSRNVIPTLAAGCSITFPDGRVVRVIDPRPFPGDGDPYHYEPLVGTGDTQARGSKS